MYISNSIEEIKLRSNKVKLTFLFGVVPLCIFLVVIFIKENRIIKYDRKYITSVYISSASTKMYTMNSLNETRIRKKNVLNTIDYNEQVKYLDSLENEWLKVVYKSDTGLIKIKDCHIETKLVSEYPVKALSYNTSKKLLSYGVVLFGIIFGIIYLNKLDRKRILVELFYEDNESLDRFSSIQNQINDLLKNHYLWYVKSESGVKDLKRNAGASKTIARTEIHFEENVLPFNNITCNISPKRLKLENKEFYFFPDVIVEKENNNINLLEYSRISIKESQTRFIESEKNYENFKVLDYTYQYMNKDGSPDKRYVNNPKYAICLYSEYEVYYQNQLLYKFMCSNPSTINFNNTSLVTPTKNSNSDDKIINEYFSLIDDLKNNLDSLVQLIKSDDDLKDLLTSNVNEFNNDNILKILDYSIMYDISKIYNIFYQHFNENREHNVALLSLASKLMGEDANFINELSYNLIHKMHDDEKFKMLLKAISEIAINPPPFILNINDKNTNQIFLLPPILKQLKSTYYDKYITFLYRVATVLTKSDNQVTNDEEKILKRIHKDLYNTSENKLQKANSSNRKKSSLDDLIKELDNLIGLEDVKSEVKSLVNFINFQSEREKHGLKQNEISYHCVFTGSPGTGKTTVARILSKIFASLKVVEKGHLIETDRSGLVAEYVGQTAVKVDKLVSEALGGVLFIDEAYSLSTDSSNDYGKEAIATLIKRMEDNRDNLVVIVAGYTDKMEEFLELNPGLKSRFNRYIHFNDYTPDELLNIYKKMCQSSDYILSRDAEDEILILFKNAYDIRDLSFGNGRYVRNIFEKSIESLSNRVSFNDKITKELLTTIIKEDIEFVRNSS